VKVKLDENIGTAGAELLTTAGFDVATVAQQQLTSAQDENIASVCAAEDRCLVTLDKDFSDVSGTRRRTMPASLSFDCRDGSGWRCWNRLSAFSSKRRSTATSAVTSGSPRSIACESTRIERTDWEGRWRQ
jgi:hypothetical protein